MQRLVLPLLLLLVASCREPAPSLEPPPGELLAELVLDEVP